MTKKRKLQNRAKDQVNVNAKNQNWLETRFFKLVEDNQSQGQDSSSKVCIMCFRPVLSEPPLELTSSADFRKFFKLIHSKISESNDNNPMNRNSLISIIDILSSDSDSFETKGFSMCSKCLARISKITAKESEVEKVERHVRSLQQELLSQMRVLHETVKVFHDDCGGLADVIENSRGTCQDFLIDHDHDRKEVRNLQKSEINNCGTSNLIAGIVVLRENILEVFRDLTNFQKKVALVANVQEKRDRFEAEPEIKTETPDEDDEFHVKIEQVENIETEVSLDIGISCRDDFLDDDDEYHEDSVGEDDDAQDPDFEFDYMKTSKLQSSMKPLSPTTSKSSKFSSNVKSIRNGNSLPCVTPKRRGRPRKYKAKVVKKTRNGFTCPRCPDLEAMDFDLFLYHLSFHQRRPNKCTECGWHLSSDPVEVEKHWKDHHELLHLNTPSGSKCSEVRVDFSNMKEELFECSDCPVTFSSEAELHQHELRFHDSSNKNVIDCSEAGCSKSYTSIENLRVHRALSHPDLVGLSCFYCDKSFAVKTHEGKVIFDFKMFLTHCKESHSGKWQIEECRHCGAGFYQRCDYISHMVTKHNEGRQKCFWCPVCFSSSFSTSSILRFHIQTIHLVSQVTCELCGQQLRDSRRLNNHKFQAHGVLEEGSKMLRCGEPGCEYQTLLASNLRVHKRKKHPVGARSRPYSCQYCGKGFFQKSHLDRHERAQHNTASKP